MSDKPVLAIFDFCGTLINIQTADPFIIGLCKRHPSHKRRSLELIRKLMLKTGVLRGRKSKTFLLKQAAGIRIDAVMDYSEKYLNETLLSNENVPVVRRMKRHKERGDKIVIVSAGYECYIGLYAKHYGIPDIVTTRLEEKKGALTGNILNKDCIGTEKVRRLCEAMDLSSFDMKKSYAYTDHISDIPLLELVGNRVVVSCGRNTDWSKAMGCELLRL